MQSQPETAGKSKKNFRWYMRYLHNNVGFLLVGLVIIYSLSGIVQTYRDTDWLKHDVLTEKNLGQNMDTTQLKEAVRFRGMKIENIAGPNIYFTDGVYNSQTGVAKYTTRQWYPIVEKVTRLHKTNSKGIAHYFTTVFGMALLFMSVSAFWMFKPGTRLFSRGVYMTVAGIVASLLLLLL